MYCCPLYHCFLIILVIQTRRLDELWLPLIWILLALVWIVNSSRHQPFYTLYLFLPTTLTLGITLKKIQGHSSASQDHHF